MTYGTIKVDNLTSSTGTVDLTTVTTDEATTSAKGYMSAADKTKLDGIATGAEVNVAYDDNVALELGTDTDTSILFDGTDTDIRLTAGDLIVEDGTTLRFEFERTTGNFNATGDITAFSGSDERLKKDIEIIPNALEKVQSLRGVTYGWSEVAEKEVDGYFVREREAGVIAQDVQKVLPEVVAERDNGYLGVRYERLVPLLIEAVKAQQVQIEELKAKLEG